MEQKRKEDHCCTVHLVLHNFFCSKKKSVLFINFKRSILLIYWPKSRLIFLDLRENKEKFSPQIFTAHLALSTSVSPSHSVSKQSDYIVHTYGEALFSKGDSANWGKLAPPQFFVDTSFYQGNQTQLKVKYLLKVKWSIIGHPSDDIGNFDVVFHNSFLRWIISFK